MSISSVSGFLGGLTGLAGADSTRQKSPGAINLARSEMDEIREKGLAEWAREQKMEALKEKIRAQILSENRMTEQGIAGLSNEQRSSVEEEIAKLVQQKMEEAMQQQMQDAARTGKTEAVLLDISI